MLKSRKFVLLFFVIATAITFLSVQPKEMDSSMNISEYPDEENGKVLGVVEEIKSENENYFQVEEIGEIIPMVDRSNFIPTKKEGTKDPILSWGSIAVKDISSGEIIFSREAERERSIASITKLFTALVLMDLDLDWDSEYVVQAEDRIEGGRIYINAGERIKLKDLLYVSLVASANTATRALVSASGLEYDEFIEAMNKKASELGLENTKLVDPVGISYLNVSTASEIAVLAEAAINNGVIRDCLQKKKYVFETVDGKSKTVNNTNILLDNFDGTDINILGGKTGYTGAAGYCNVAMFENNNHNNIVTVILGSRSHSSRFSDTEKLAHWVYGNYIWTR